MRNKCLLYFLIPLFFTSSAHSNSGPIDLYPGNKDRQIRANELLGDINGFVHDTDTMWKKIHKKLDDIELTHEKMYINLNVPMPQELNQPLALEHHDLYQKTYHTNLVLGKYLASALGEKTKKALNRSISRRLFKKGLVTLGQKGLSKIIATSTTKLMNIKGLIPGAGGMAGSFVIELGLLTVSDAIIGSEKRDYLRRIINETFKNRRTIYLDFLISDNLHRHLSIYLNTIKTINNLDLPADIILSARESATALFTEQVNNVSLEDADKFLSLFDKERNSWVEGDPTIQKVNTTK